MPNEQYRVRTAATPFQLRDNRRLSWYAATFNQPYRVFDWHPVARQRTFFDEIVLPGAFAPALRGSGEVEANIDHDSRRRFALRSTGELLLQEDPIGLYATVFLPKNDVGDDVVREYEAGRLRGASFRGDYHTSDQWSADKCVVSHVPLKDVCVTSTPANPNTEVRLRTARINEWFALLKILELKNKYRD